VLEYLPSTLKTLSPIPSTGKKERKANGRRKKWREGGREGRRGIGKEEHAR
jgi:hypothetical protein